MKNIGVILAGGTGERAGGNTPKQYMFLDGKEVIAYSVDAFENSKNTDAFIIVADAEESKKRNLADRYGVPCVNGGKHRNGTVFNALSYIKENIPECRSILFHDSARPFIKPETIDIYFDFLNEYDAVITAQHLSDSLGRNDRHIFDREEYYLIQTPEAFNFELLYGYFSKDSSCTAIIQQLPFEIKLKKYFEFRTNFKITYPEDIKIAEQMLKINTDTGSNTGLGFHSQRTDDEKNKKIREGILREDME